MRPEVKKKISALQLKWFRPQKKISEFLWTQLKRLRKIAAKRTLALICLQLLIQIPKNYPTDCVMEEIVKEDKFKHTFLQSNNRLYKI